MTINYVSSKHKKPIKLNKSNLQLLKLIGDLGFVNLNQLDMLWSVICHYPTCFTRSILREWISYDGLLKKIDKPKTKRPSNLSRAIYHLTNNAKLFLAKNDIWPTSAVNAPNIGFNSHNEQAIEVIVQGIYAAAFKYQVLGTANQLFKDTKHHSYVITNPNFIEEQIIVNKTLKAPDGAGAQQTSGAKSKGRTVAGPQQASPVEQDSRTMPPILTNTATTDKTINDKTRINETVQKRLPDWLASYLPNNGNITDTLPLLTNHLGRLLIDGVLVPSIVITDNPSNRHSERINHKQSIPYAETNKSISNNNIDLANNPIRDKLSNVPTISAISNHQASMLYPFVNKTALAGKDTKGSLTRKTHREDSLSEATGKLRSTATQFLNSDGLGDAWLKLSRKTPGLSLYKVLNCLNPGLSSYCHLKGMLNTGAKVALWLTAYHELKTGDELKHSKNKMLRSVAITPHRKPRKHRQNKREPHLKQTNTEVQSNSNRANKRSQEAVRDFFSDAQREQSINDHLEVYADRQWRESYDIEDFTSKKKQGTQGNDNDTDLQGLEDFFGIKEFSKPEGKQPAKIKSRGTNSLKGTPNKETVNDDYIDYLAEESSLDTDPSVFLSQEQKDNQDHQKESSQEDTQEGATLHTTFPSKEVIMRQDSEHIEQAKGHQDTVAPHKNHSQRDNKAVIHRKVTTNKAHQMSNKAANNEAGKYANSEGSFNTPKRKKSASAPVEALPQTPLPAVPSATHPLNYNYPNQNNSLNIQIAYSTDSPSSLLTPHKIQSTYNLTSSHLVDFQHPIDWSHLLWPQINIYLKLAQINLRHWSHHLDRLTFTDSQSSTHEEIKLHRFSELNSKTLTRDLNLINNTAFRLDDYNFSPFNRQFGNSFAEKNELPFVADMMVSFNRHHVRHELFIELDNRTETNDRQANKILNYLQYAIKHPNKDIEVIIAVTDGSLSSNRVKKFSNVGRKLGNLANRIMQTFVIQNGKRVYLADLYQKASNLQVRLCGVSETYLDVAEYLLGSNYFPDYLVSLNKLVKVMNKETDWQAKFVPSQMFKELLDNPELLTQVEGMNGCKYRNDKTKGLKRYLPAEKVNQQNVWGNIVFSYPKANISYQQPVLFGHEHELNTVMETYNLSYLAKKSSQYGYPIVIYPHRERLITSVSLPLFKSLISWSDYYGFRQPLIVQPRFSQKDSLQLRQELRWLTIQYARTIHQFFLKVDSQLVLAQRERYYQNHFSFLDIESLRPARSLNELHQLAKKLPQSEFVNQLQLNELPKYLINQLLSRWPRGLYSSPIISSLPYWNNQIEETEHSVKEHYEFSEFFYNLDSVLPDSRTQPKI